MYTLSIIQARQKLQQVVETFEGVTSYKVEFGLWNHSEKPFIQLCVSCKVNEETHFLHAQADTFFHALQSLQKSYTQISQQELVVESEDILY